MSSYLRYLASAAALLSATTALAGAPAKTPELVAKGKASYDINCASCHGPKGKGDGVAASALATKPRDLVAGKYAKGAAPQQIFDTLSKGLPGTAMVSYGHLSEEERWAITYYVEELRGAKSAKK
jgi:mono/diheme cytochrome c family protein